MTMLRIYLIVAVSSVLGLVLYVGAGATLVFGLIPGLGTCNVWDLDSLKKQVNPIVHGTGLRLLGTYGCNQFDEPVTYTAEYAEELDCSAITTKAAVVLDSSPHRNTQDQEGIAVSEGSPYFDVGGWRIHMECDHTFLSFVVE